MVLEMVLSFFWVLFECNCVLDWISNARDFGDFFCCELLPSILVYFIATTVGSRDAVQTYLA